MKIHIISDHIQAVVRKTAGHVSILARLRTMMESFFLDGSINFMYHLQYKMAFWYMDVL